MEFSDDQIGWEADGEVVRIGFTRYGQGPSLLLLPALSSISTRAEMRPLQERLGKSFSTVAIDWPGFGVLPRPQVDWRSDHFRAFLRFVLEKSSIPPSRSRPVMRPATRWRRPPTIPPAPAASA